MSDRSNEPDQLLESLLAHDEPQATNGAASPPPEDDDVDALIDELEAMFAEAKRVPFGRRLMVDEARALEFIDRLRTAFPAEVRQAQRILDEQDRILDEARNQAHAMLQERGLMAELEVQRERTIARAEQEAERMRAEADAYVRGVLTDLDERLSKLHASVSNGLEALSPREES